MNDSSQAISPRRRLQTLLAIPDNQRTEEQWDEIIELEISLAPVNQITGGEKQAAETRSSPRQARGARQPRSGSSGNGPRTKKTFKKPTGGAPKGPARGAVGGE
ncbi:hypothetical protein [Ectothiorhodospira lacustris]|uniref:hypothetical protein n=1 Tax=Ectothiorhodospira lacustris TaxID=2899127 RepID=UPI001EE964E4|nr:hypothetical protein [Ectothiorhodospira lacustris]MCG5499883.1 hypothetical protein [Ectothiorhodospira lacustris]MCG5509027.1 hypothetical protein [Ectothiorhodospira lacustris]MCG5520818.1 hypothetical protein [Ectothiorhodospira lacustris]